MDSDDLESEGMDVRGPKRGPGATAWVTGQAAPILQPSAPGITPLLSMHHVVNARRGQNWSCQHVVASIMAMHHCPVLQLHIVLQTRHMKL